MPREQFEARYQSVGDGWFRPTGVIRALRNPFRLPVAIRAPWGQDQYGDEHCWFACPTGDPARVYLIGAIEFAGTYEPARA